jgi:type I restriction enzyme S subunit
MKIENKAVAEDWKTVPLKGNLKILSGFPFDSADFNEVEGTPLIRIRNLLNGVTDTLFKGKFSDEFLISKGEILIGMDGDFHIVKWTGRDALLNQRIMKIGVTYDSALDINYCYYLLQPFLLNVHARTAATTVKHLSTKDLNNAYFKVPPLPEQRKIAEILSTVDEKMAVIDEQLVQTQELKKGLMQRLLTKGIGHVGFKDSPSGEIPENWQVAKLNNLVKKVGSGITPQGGRETYLKKGILFIRSQNVLFGKLKLDDVAFISREQHEKMSNSHLIPNDVLLNITGASIGRSSVVPETIAEGNVNQHVCIIRTNDKLDSQFLCQFLNSSFGQKQIDKFQAGGNRQGLNFQQIRSFNIPLPSINEQRQIAEILTTIDDKLQVLIDKKVQYQELKRGLMQQLLTGQRRVKLRQKETVLA